MSEKECILSRHEKSSIRFALLITTLLVFSDFIISPVFLIYIYERLSLNLSAVAMLMAYMGLFIAVIDYPTSHLADVGNKLFIALLGSIFMAVGTLMYGISLNYFMAVVGLLVKAFGMAMFSGCISGWVVDELKNNSSYEAVVAKYVSFSTICSRLGIVLSLIVAYFLIDKWNMGLVFVMSSFGYALSAAAIAFVISRQLGASKLSRVVKDGLRAFVAQPLFTFFWESLKTKEHRRVYFIYSVQSVYFVIFVTYWQLLAKSINYTVYLPVLTLVGFVSSLIIAMALPILDRNNVLKYKLKVVLLLTIVLFVLTLVSLSRMPSSKIWFVAMVISFQMSNTLMGVLVNTLAMKWAPSRESSAKYFSLASSLSEFASFAAITACSLITYKSGSANTPIAYIAFPGVVICLYIGYLLHFRKVEVC